MRLQDSCFKGIKENPSNDFRITVSTKTDTYSVRVVRVILKSGEVETLVTNLSENEFSADDFLDLYFLRWGIETTYDTLKNKLLIEKFAGRSPVAVLQEYYAMMFVLNCIAAMSATVNRKLVLKLSITLDTLTARIMKLSSDSQSRIEPTPFYSWWDTTDRRADSAVAPVAHEISPNHRF